MVGFNKLFLVWDGDKSRGFRTTLGIKQPIFILPETWEARRDATQPIFFTEGPVKALALHQAGVLSIGLNGTYASEMAFDRRFRQLIRTLRENFEWFGRIVYFVFDADQLHKSGVRRSLLRNFMMLGAEGAEIRRLTSWKVEHGKGVDDYLANKCRTEDDQIVIDVDKLTALATYRQLPLFVDDAQYQDESGNFQYHVPPGMVLVAAMAIQSKIAYAAVAQIDETESYMQPFEGARIPQVRFEKGEETRMFRLAARPIPVPADTTSWTVLQAI